MVVFIVLITNGYTTFTVLTINTTNSKITLWFSVQLQC